MCACGGGGGGGGEGKGGANQRFTSWLCAATTLYCSWPDHELLERILGTSALLSQLACVRLAPPEGKPGSWPIKQKKETWHFKETNRVAEQTRGDGMAVAVQKDVPLHVSSQSF